MMSKKQYEAETGEKALYRKGSSDYHTLRYVRWLQAENEKLKELLEKILKREACTCNAYDCDCTWELVCKAINPKRWAKLQAQRGGEE